MHRFTIVNRVACSSLMGYPVHRYIVSISVRQRMPPVAEVMARRNRGDFSLPNSDIIAVSSASMETSADARLIAFAAERAGLFCLRNFTTFTTAVMMFKSEQSVISSLNHVATIAICRRGALLLSFSVGD